MAGGAAAAGLGRLRGGAQLGGTRGTEGPRCSAAARGRSLCRPAGRQLDGKGAGSRVGVAEGRSVWGSTPVSPALPGAEGGGTG